MDEIRPDDFGSAPTIEVTVYRHGDVVQRVLCESDDEVQSVIDQWGEVEGTEFQVDDLSVQHRPGDVLEPDAGDGYGDDER
jgi:hypothetical protein